MLPVTMTKYLYYETPPTHNNRSCGFAWLRVICQRLILILHMKTQDIIAIAKGSFKISPLIIQPISP